MTDKEKIVRLKRILAKQIKWYTENMETRGEDYVYDELYQVFNDLSRSDFIDIVETVIKD